MSHFVPADLWPRARPNRSIFQYVPYQRIGLFTALSDFALILVTCVACGILYNALIFDTEGNVAAYVAIGCYSGLIFSLLCRFLGLYRPNTLLSASSQMRGVVLAWAGVLMFVVSAFFLLKAGANYSRVATTSFSVVGLAVVLASRAITGSSLGRALADGTIAGRRAIVIGDPDELANKSALDLLRTYGTREVGRFEFSPAKDSTASTVADELALVDAGIRAAQVSRAEQVLLALRWVDTCRRNAICDRLRILPLPVLLLPDRSVTSVLSGTDGSRNALGAIEVQRAPMARQDLVIKRVMDVMLAGLGLLLLSPLLLMISAAIVLDSSGPVIFRQRRRGFNGEEFAIYKFRTMTVLEDGPRVQQCRRDDHRVTKLGRLLRATSIDELPQLFNVLSGQMSLVGPRPHALAHDDEYADSIKNYAFRHHVKPGITGWAQTHGFRGETADVNLMKKRVQLDLWYINNWSLWLDFRILGRTCIELMKPHNAY
jgi:Undecaprenyl-phosphate glucose phosphotransferase